MENIMKKSAVIILAVFFLTASAVAQSRVDAKDILKSIDEGKAINYSGATIIGDLNLTSIKDMVPDKDNKPSRHSTDVFWYHVRSPLTFTNCTFEGDVIAYYHDEDKNETHNAVFRGKSAFKYSTFHEGADFANTKYSKEALFKYTEFTSEVSFAQSEFSHDANFKYTKFPQNVDFSNTRYHKLANFKYTKFPKGVSFKNALFRGDSVFKYTKFYEPFDFEGTEFEDSVDFKYTKLEGKSFTKYLLKNRK
jgi:hypothetical protein